MLKKHYKREEKISVLRTRKTATFQKITDSRKSHVKTFKNVKSIETKKSIIQNRLNIKSEMLSVISIAGIAIHTQKKEVAASQQMPQPTARAV